VEERFVALKRLKHHNLTCFNVRFEVLTAASTKMAVFWVAAPCSLVEVYRHITLMMEAASISETSVNFYQTTAQQVRRPPSSVFNVFFAKCS
jgi:hypothetical protein